MNFFLRCAVILCCHSRENFFITLGIFLVHVCGQLLCQPSLVWFPSLFLPFPENSTNVIQQHVAFGPFFFTQGYCFEDPPCCCMNRSLQLWTLVVRLLCVAGMFSVSFDKCPGAGLLGWWWRGCWTLETATLFPKGVVPLGNPSSILPILSSACTDQFMVELF